MGDISLGMHYAAELYDCCKSTINDKDRVREAMIVAARIAKATIVADVFHEFNPHGISGVVVIAESHIAIHSWPEYGCASVDIFTCSSDMRPQAAVDFLAEVFKARRVEVKKFQRGLISLKNDTSEVSL